MKKNSNPISRSELRRQEFEQRIVNAAIELFGEHGVEETSVVSIIEKAGIAYKTFFNHFPNKENLIFHIANIYSSYSDLIFEESLKMPLCGADRIEHSLVTIASEITSLDPSEATVFRRILVRANLGPEQSKEEQNVKLYHAIWNILIDARDKGELQEALSPDIYTEMIVGLFIAGIFSWANQEGYPLVQRMQRTAAFIRHSMFK